MVLATTRDTARGGVAGALVASRHSPRGVLLPVSLTPPLHIIAIPLSLVARCAKCGTYARIVDCRFSPCPLLPQLSALRSRPLPPPMPPTTNKAALKFFKVWVTKSTTAATNRPPQWAATSDTASDARERGYKSAARDPYQPSTRPLKTSWRHSARKCRKKCDKMTHGKKVVAIG